MEWVSIVDGKVKTAGRGTTREVTLEPLCRDFLDDTTEHGGVLKKIRVTVEYLEDPEDL